MFVHNFKYTLKTLFKNKVMIFWTFAFPIILGTFFYMAFSNIENSEAKQVIDIAVIDNEEFQKDTILKETFASLSKEDEQQLFSIRYVNKEEAGNLLDKKEIIGYVTVTDKYQLTVKQNGIEQTVLQFVIDEIIQFEKVMQDVIEKEVTDSMGLGVMPNYAQIYQEALQILKQDITLPDHSNPHMSYTMIEYYTLIAMACLYGAMFGVVVINKSLANMSSQGARVSVAPLAKWKLLTSGTLAGFLVQYLGIVLLLLYTVLVLHVDYGSSIGYVILLSMVGSLAGLTLGIAVGSLSKTSENGKTGIIIALTMLGCFLSGMMGITMKYIVDTNVPIINKINPASMITDGFYSLYYYATMDRFFFNIISLLIFSAVMLLLSLTVLRRRTYDSI